jgi:prepilin-type N-terminal cleavage/methylation domain-containing protein
MIKKKSVFSFLFLKRKPYQSRNKVKSRNGYTLIEILISLTILSILFLGGYTAYREYIRRQIVQNTSQEIKSNLALVRQKALSGDSAEACTQVGSNNNLLGYQITFLATSYSVKPVCTSIAASQSYTVTYTLPQSVSLTTSGISGSLQYNTVSGTNLSANATITLRHLSGGTKVLTISPNGVVQ